MTKLADVVEATAIRPFHVCTPEADLTELRRRINVTRFPEQETVADFLQACNSPVCKRSRDIERPITTGGGARCN
jgi:hypothetical protein